MRIQRGLPTFGVVGAIAIAAAILYATRDPTRPVSAAHGAMPAIESRTTHDVPTLLEGSGVGLPSVEWPQDAKADTKQRNPAEPDPALPTRARVRAVLAQALSRHLPEVKLSAVELEDLADATLRMREARTALRRLAKTAEHALERSHEQHRLSQAIDDFTYVLRMTPDEFTRRVDPDGGIDEWLPKGPLGPIETRTLADPDPRT